MYQMSRKATDEADILPHTNAREPLRRDLNQDIGCNARCIRLSWTQLATWYQKPEW